LLGDILSKYYTGLLLMVLLCCLCPSKADAQTWNNLRTKKFATKSDTLRLDTLSILSGSLIISDMRIDSSFYFLDESKALLILNRKKINSLQPPPDSLTFQFRVFPFNLSKTYSNKARRLSTDEEIGNFNPFVYTHLSGAQNPLKMDGLNKNGSISRGVSFGNNQDLTVNSTLNLQLSGKLSNDIDVMAAITDDNIPIQPDGNTAQLQDFDRVFIQLSNGESKLVAGDFTINRPESYFMNFNKRLQGGSFGTTLPTQILPKGKHAPAKVKVGGSVAVARGRFHRNTFPAVEGNQGPYRLRGVNNEQFIVVLSGSEKVYIDGRMLKRGQEYDYVIDYNTAEITFTSRVLITKDLRIFVEFEYSERNFARSLVYFNNEIEQGRFTARLNVYSEQDSRNQPLQQSLSDEDKEILRNAGDNLSQAIIPSVENVGFTADLVLYRMTDTIVNGAVFNNVLVFSNNPQEATYRATFSNVGPNNGNYRQESSVANGRVFQWIAPVNGIPQGSFEPLVQLIPPSRQQIMTFGTEYRLGKQSKIMAEIAYSNFDKNTFSERDADDNGGYALRVSFNDTRKVKRDSASNLFLSTILSYEQVDRFFQPIERFRNVEFERDWNVNNLVQEPQTDFIPSAALKLFRKGGGFAQYTFTTYIKGQEFNAGQHFLNVDSEIGKSKVRVNYWGGITTADGARNNSNFYRHRSHVSKRFRYLTIGYIDELEDNRINDAATDTFRLSTYAFFDRQAYISNSDTSKFKYRIFYRVRTDDQVLNQQLTQYAYAESYGITTDFSNNPNIQVRTITGVRRLYIEEPLLTAQEPENTLNNRLELNLKLFKNAISSNTFYEVGSGLETRREFTYLQVPAGQGVYTWTDYNGNGIKELNEFEIAPFPDLAQYIRVFTPSNEFIKVFSNQFSQITNIRPANVWKNAKGWKKLINRFAAQSAVRIDAKTSTDDMADAYNPFSSRVDDPELITFNSSVRNTLFFNRNDPKFGLDFNNQQTANRALLSNGFEARFNRFNNFRLRWNFTDKFTFNAETRQGVRGNQAEAINNRDFTFDYVDLEPAFVYQPNAAFRFSLLYRRKNKVNRPEFGSERLTGNDFGVDLKYNVLSKGSLQFRFNFIDLTYNAAENTPLAFEMLEGLRSGRNLTWGISWQRTLANNMQLNLNYDGRRSPGVSTVHTGGVQVRAFF
jgi:hypothetical protein